MMELVVLVVILSIVMVSVVTLPYYTINIIDRLLEQTSMVIRRQHRTYQRQQLFELTFQADFHFDHPEIS